LDSNDAEQPVIQSGTSLSLVDGVFVDQRVTDYVYGDFSDDLRATDYLDKFSFSVYYKFVSTDNSVALTLFSTRDGSNNGWRIIIQKNSNTNAKIYVSYNGSNFYLDTGNTVTTSLNQFYHVAMTSYNGTMKLYHDGIEVYSNSDKLFLPKAPNNNLYKIGEGGAKAEIDQVKVYKGTLLTPTQIANMATYSTDYTPPPSDPNAITDITTFGDTSVSNDIITFDGDGDYAIYTGAFQYTAQHSVSFWFRTTANNRSFILSSHIANGSPVQNGFYFDLNNGNLFVRTLDSAGSNNAGSGLHDGQWHHVVMNYQENTTGGRSIYVDNTEVVSANSGVSNAFMSEFGLFIGALGSTNLTPNNNFTGDFYGLQVTNTILTPTQIAAIYNAGVPT